MKKAFTYILFALVLISINTSCSSTKKTRSTSSRVTKPRKPVSLYGFESSGDFYDALDKAKAQKKQVFLYLYFDKCPPCKLMDEYVFSDKELGAFFKKNFISIKIDIEDKNGADLATIFNTNSYPTLLFLNDKGQSLIESRGKAVYQTELRDLAEKALSLK